MKAGWAIGARAAHAYFIEEAEREPAQSRRVGGSHSSSSAAGKHREEVREAAEGVAGEEAWGASGSEGPERRGRGNSAGGRSRADERYTPSSSGSSSPETSAPRAEAGRSQGRSNSRAGARIKARGRSREAGLSAGLDAGPGGRTRGSKTSSAGGPSSAGRSGRRAKVAVRRWKRGKSLLGGRADEEEAQVRVQTEADAPEPVGIHRATSGDGLIFEPRSAGLAEGRRPVRAHSWGQAEPDEGQEGDEEPAVAAQGARIGGLIREFVQKQRAKESELVAHRLEAAGIPAGAQGLLQVGVAGLGKAVEAEKKGQEAEEDAHGALWVGIDASLHQAEHGADARSTDQKYHRSIPHSAPGDRPGPKADTTAARPLASSPGTREWPRSPSLRKAASRLSAMHLSPPSQAQGDSLAQAGTHSQGGAHGQAAEKDPAARGEGGAWEERGAGRARVQRSVSSTSDAGAVGVGGAGHGVGGAREGAVRVGAVSPGSPASDRSSPPRTSRAARWASVGPPGASPTRAPSTSYLGRVMGTTHSESGPSTLLPLSWHFPLLPKARSTAVSELAQTPAQIEEAAKAMRRMATDGKRNAGAHPASTGLLAGSVPTLQPGPGKSSEAGGANAGRGSSKQRYKGSSEEAPRAKALGGKAAAASAAHERGHNKSGQGGSQQRQRAEHGRLNRTGTKMHRTSAHSKGTNTKGSMKSSNSVSSSGSGMRPAHNWVGSGALGKPLPTAQAGQMMPASRLHRASSDGAVLQGVLEEIEEEGQGQEAPGYEACSSPATRSTTAEAGSDTAIQRMAAVPGVGISLGSLGRGDAKHREHRLPPDSMRPEDSNRSSNTSSSGRSSTSASTSSNDAILERFELDDLRLATSNFHSRYLLGAGSFGRVYAGCLQGWASAGADGLLGTESSASHHSGAASPLSTGAGRQAQVHSSAVHCSGAISPAMSPTRLGPATHSLPASPLRARPSEPGQLLPQDPPSLSSDTAAVARGLAAAASPGAKSHADADVRSGASDGRGSGVERRVGYGSSAGSGRLVAIKVLSSRHQGMDEWLNELSMARFTADHPNVVRLRGYCFDEGFSMLVYDLCTKGNLSDYIMPADSASDGAPTQHGDMAKLEEGEPGREKHIGDARDGDRVCEEDGNAERQRDPLLAQLRASHAPLTWAQRLHVMRGVVAGLAHLHSHNIIHSDLKLANILLDQELNAKLSDYGLAKQLGSGKDGYLVTQKVMGTVGYLDPAYYRTGQLRRDSDVYSLGVVLLQLLTGRPAHDFEEGRPLVMLMRPYITLALSLHGQEVQAGEGAHDSGGPLQGSEAEQASVAPAPLAPKMAALKRQLDRIMDPSVLGHYSVLSALRVLQIAARCVAMEGQARPDIRSIHDQLALLS